LKSTPTRKLALLLTLNVEGLNMHLYEQFEKWLDYEVNVKGELDPQTASMLDVDLFCTCAEQMTAFPNGTIWNEDYFFEWEEFVTKFLGWLKEQETIQLSR
jgi:hypothetical protein